MDEALILQLLKIDLQISVGGLDSYLQNLIVAAIDMITVEGATLGQRAQDESLVVMYAAYLYRKRRGEVTAMPRPLRYALNNRVLSEKGAANG